MNKVTEKPWGTTELVIDSPIMTAHRLNIVKGGYCSFHHHYRKWNGFVVIKGFLRIILPSVPDRLLGPGDVAAVGPGIRHRFFAETEVECMEWYWPDTLSEDIERGTSQSGVLEEAARGFLPPSSYAKGLKDD